MQEGGRRKEETEKQRHTPQREELELELELHDRRRGVVRCAGVLQACIGVCIRPLQG